MRLIWYDKKPTSAGWYWYKDSEIGQAMVFVRAPLAIVEINQVVKVEGFSFLKQWTMLLSDLNGFWSVEIESPYWTPEI